MLANVNAFHQHHYQTHSGLPTRICLSELDIYLYSNDLLPAQCQIIACNNPDLFMIGPQEQGSWQFESNADIIKCQMQFVNHFAEATPHKLVGYLRHKYA